MLLTDRNGVTFTFDPGAPCLELAHTGGPGWMSVFESLHTPADLAAFLAGYLRGEPHAGPGLRAGAGESGPDAEAAARAAGLATPVTSDDLAAALALRDAIWPVLEARIAGTPLPADAVATINAAAAEPPEVWHITPDGQRARRAPVPAEQLVASFARDAVEVLADPAGAERLRRCSGDNCFLVFVDTSRPGRRRWCSMERCGNRAKVRNFRHRSHESPTGGQRHDDDHD